MGVGTDCAGRGGTFLRSRRVTTERASIDLRGKNSIAKVLTIGRPICERSFRRIARS
jgi:hypothetical protein